jgi:hypothetical protein
VECVLCHARDRPGDRRNNPNTRTRACVCNFVRTSLNACYVLCRTSVKAYRSVVNETFKLNFVHLFFQLMDVDPTLTLDSITGGAKNMALQVEKVVNS